MKTSRFRQDYRASASALHKRVGNLLREVFKLNKVYQEYPVNRVNPTYQYASHHYDWVILDLLVVVEVHGQQHYKAVGFGGGDAGKAVDALRATQSRDRMKMQAAVDAGFTYIEIPWYDVDEVDAEYIWAKIQEHRSDTPKQKVVDPYKERQRKYKRDQYQLLKRRREDERNRHQENNPSTQDP
tara:strand:+ start:959 stop:1510 length:552 start_codon:yes stop_codon:yes gene_type:complete